jgi:hypothetical protein
VTATPTEFEFGLALRRCLGTSGKWSDGLVLSEVEIGEGVPDLVLVRLPGKTADQVQSQLASLPAEPFLNGYGALLAELERRAHTIEYLTRRTGLSREYVLKAGSFLCRLGWARRTETGSMMLADDFVLPPFRITAFELKLADVRRALGQAIRYQQFAHDSVVVLPTNRAGSLEGARTLIMDSALGSATFDAANCSLNFFVKPRTQSPRSRQAYMHAVGRLIGHLAEGPRKAGSRFPRSSSGSTLVGIL